MLSSLKLVVGDAYEVMFNGTAYFVVSDEGSREATPEELHGAALLMVTTQIKDERDRRKFEGVYVGANRFHSDADSRTQQIGLVLMGANLPAVQWKTMGGAFVTMTPTLAQQIFGATAARDIAIFANAEAHIAAATAAADPLLYDFSTGWPE